VKKNDLSADWRTVLSRLIAFDSDGRAVWPAEDLQKSLTHQLALSPFSEMAWQIAPEAAHSLDYEEADEEPIRTFADLLHHRRPPLGLLRLAKDFAKQHHDNSRSPIPPDVSLLMYYGSIVAAMIRWNQRITRLSDDDLRAGLNWVIRQPWVEGQLLSLFQEGLRFMRSPRREWRS
jgi:hypothetical protein